MKDLFALVGFTIVSVLALTYFGKLDYLEEGLERTMTVAKTVLPEIIGE